MHGRRGPPGGPRAVRSQRRRLKVRGVQERQGHRDVFRPQARGRLRARTHLQSRRPRDTRRSCERRPQLVPRTGGPRLQNEQVSTSDRTDDLASPRREDLNHRPRDGLFHPVGLRRHLELAQQPGGGRLHQREARREEGRRRGNQAAVEYT